MEILILLLQKNKYIIIMKTIMFVLPIGIITHYIYEIKYGSYNVVGADEYLKYFFTEQSVFTIAVFCLLNIVLYYLHKDIIPVLMMKSGSYTTSLYESWRILRSVKSTKAEIFLKKKKSQFKIYKNYSEICVLLALWSISLLGI